MFFKKKGTTKVRCLLFKVNHGEKYFPTYYYLDELRRSLAYFVCLLKMKGKRKLIMSSLLAIWMSHGNFFFPPLAFQTNHEDSFDYILKIFHIKCLIFKSEKPTFSYLGIGMTMEFVVSIGVIVPLIIFQRYKFMILSIFETFLWFLLLCFAPMSKIPFFAFCIQYFKL
jgi:hypothetical protein